MPPRFCSVDFPCDVDAPEIVEYFNWQGVTLLSSRDNPTTVAVGCEHRCRAGAADAPTPA